MTITDALNKAKSFRATGPRNEEEEAMLLLACEVNKLAALERQYCESLGDMARLADVVCSWVLNREAGATRPEPVTIAADEIMEYVEAVRP